ncbi:MAG TPA: hypothetical protein VD866_07965 [Urbifossiella sp.]|nr:hypothetical protein [Urbifossiella sp.]
MSWLGKILAVLVLLLALVWMWFTVSVFAARTNWKTRADNYEKAHKDAVAARDNEYRTGLAEQDALRRQLKSAQAEAQGLSTQVAKLKDDVDKNGEQIKLINAGNDKREALTSELQALNTAANTRADKLGQRVNTLEAQKVKDAILVEQSLKDKQAAETVARQATQDKENALKKLEEVSNQLADARASGFGGGTGGFSLTTPRPVPIKEGTRGTVEAYREGSVQFSLGIDHGVTTGATLDIYRTGTDARYLGTIVVDIARPQTSSGTFRPSDPRRPLRSLRPEELPKVGDRVGRVGSSLSP